MKILVIGINYAPEKTGIAPVIKQRCEFLREQGHDVQVCTGMPYYPDWKIADGYRGKWWVRETIEGVDVRRGWLWVPREVTAKKRILHEASFIASAFLRALRAKKPDLLIVESPPLGLGAIAILLARLWRIPFLFDVMDLQPDAAADLGLLPPGRILNFLYKVERMAYRHAALVTTLTGEMAQRIRSKGIEAAKVVVCPIPATEAAFAVHASSAGGAFRKQHGLGDEFLVVHSGNMGVKQGLGVVLQAAARTRDKAITYLMIGSGADRPRLEAQAAEMKLNNVRFLPVLPDADFAAALSAADLALVCQQKSVSDIFFPSKTITYLAAGKPVFASVNRDSRVASTVLEAQAGEVISPEDPDALATRISAAYEDRSRLGAWSGAAHTYARRQWDPARVLQRYEQELESLVRTGKAADLTLRGEAQDPT